MAELTPDDLNQIKRFIGLARDILERYGRAMEELDSLRLAMEEIRETLSDHFGENSRWADDLSRKMDRLERYVILVRIVGSNTETIAVEGAVSREHIERALREELVSQQELILQYQRNIDRVKIRIAKFGETVPLMNELDDYQKQVEKADEAMERIRDALK